MTTPVQNKSWIAGMLADVPVVEWDRFVLKDDDGTQCVKVYGWIDREDDDYKDFVLVDFWPQSKNIGFTTSSDEWSEYLHHEWIGGEPDGHNSCRRVEHTFDIDNAVQLYEDQSLDVFSDGGTPMADAEQDGGSR